MSADPDGSAPNGKAGPTGLTALSPCRHGRFLYLPHDTYIGRALHLYGEFSELEDVVIREMLRPGGVALDIGANMGAHTIPMARRVGPTGQVIAFEPQRVIFTLLAANIALNEAFQVTPMNVAVGDGPGVVNIPPLDYAAANNFGALSLADHGHRAGEPVPVVTIDTLDLPRVDLMKIDVEGMELAALRGAAATIARCRPLIYVENERPAESEALIRHLLDLDYRLWWHRPPLFNPDNFRGVAENVYENVVSTNMICLPRERPATIKGYWPVLGPADRPQIPRPPGAAPEGMEP